MVRIAMREADRSTFGIAVASLASSLCVFSLAFLAGAYFICVKYHICLFEPGKFL